MIMQQTIINESEIDDMFGSIYTTIISKYKKISEKVWTGLLIQ